MEDDKDGNEIEDLYDFKTRRRYPISVHLLPGDLEAKSKQGTL